MSSPKMKKTHVEEEDSILEYSNIERRLFSAIEKLGIIFENMPKPPNSQRSFRPSLGLNNVNHNLHMQIATMDQTSRIMANKVLNVFLFKVWRRRCDEVHNLHELVYKYQQQMIVMRNELLQRNSIICTEQRHSERLDMELRKMRKRDVKPLHSCATIDKALEVSQNNEKQLRQELMVKEQECINISDLLSETKREMFRELTKFRECARELAEQQRNNSYLEQRNAELEDEILKLKNCFENNDSQLDEGNQILQDCEMNSGLELSTPSNERYNYLNCVLLRKLNAVHRALRIAKYSIYLQLPYFKCIVSEIVTKLLDYMIQNRISRTKVPVASANVYIAFVILIGALC